MKWSFIPKESKLVYLVEAQPRQPAGLRPGQPVDVTLAPVASS